MKISVIQYDISWEDKHVNFRRIEDLLSTLAAGTELVILPEMFTTGFSMNPQKLCEEPLSETYKWMLKISSERKFAICGTYIVKDGACYYNRWVLVTPAGEPWHYDKRHLFTISGEEEAFTPGKERMVFKFANARICPNICYDLRFPVWSRNRNDYDLLVNSANWPEARRDVWLTLLKARAIENQCYVAASNRVGSDGNGIKYCGDSMIINPKGQIIAQADNKECVITADISMEELSDFRSKFPVLSDADNFIITG